MAITDDLLGKTFLHNSLTNFSKLIFAAQAFEDCSTHCKEASRASASDSQLDFVVLHNSTDSASGGIAWN
jgi:hypothetical protein